MNSFYEHHRDSIRWRYRCFDRILLNGLIQPFQRPERVVGFFSTYRQLYPVSRHVLRDIAEQFQCWLKGWSERRNIPIVEAPKGRRDDFVDPYFKGAGADAVVVILKAREPARIVTAIGDSKANRWHLQIANRWVVQYNFYINDRHWGRMFVRICPYLPFSARVCLNQHHWLANRMREEGIAFKQCANAFIGCAKPERLQQLADSLTSRDLVSCGQKWLARLTPFFTARERQESGCQHRLFFSQVEFCDNLIFRRRAALDQLGERLLDANRTIGQPNKITVIFGRRISKHYRGKLQTEIEDMDLPNPVIRSHYGNGFVKQYVRDHLILRTEAASNNVNDYGVSKSVENLPALRNALAAINDNYLNVQQDILETFIDRGQLRKLAEPTITASGKRIPGLKLDHPRQLALMHALVRFAHIAGGNSLTTAELYPRVLAALGCPAESYTLGALRYDLAKLRAKGLVVKLPHSRLVDEDRLFPLVPRPRARESGELSGTGVSGAAPTSRPSIRRDSCSPSRRGDRLLPSPRALPPSVFATTPLFFGGLFVDAATDKDIWQIIALIKKLPTTSEADFKAGTAPQAPLATAPSVAPPKESNQ